MPNPNPQAFGNLTKRIIRRIAAHCNKKVSYIQDNIGEQLGVSRHGIRFWEAGHIPADTAMVSRLVHTLSQFGGGADSNECQKLFSLANVSSLPSSPVINFSKSHNRKPVTQPVHFYGRNLQLNYLFDGLKKMTSMAIYGPRRSGKTSLLNMVRTMAISAPTSMRTNQRKEWLPYASNYHWIYMDLQDERLRVRDGFLRHILHGMDIPAPDVCNTSAFLDLASDQVFSPTVILIDELEAGLMSPELDQSFWQSLRSWTTVQSNGNVMFITASVMPPMQTAEEYHKPSPFFNVFRLIQELGPNTYQESVDQMHGFGTPDVDTEWIYTASYGWPALIEIICDERMYAIEHGLSDNAWKEEAQRQIHPFQYLWEKYK